MSTLIGVPLPPHLSGLRIPAGDDAGKERIAHGALAGAKTSEGAAAAVTDTTKTFRWRLQHIEPSTSANYKIYEQWAQDINTALPPAG